jgi:hypothetical protein
LHDTLRIPQLVKSGFCLMKLEFKLFKGTLAGLSAFGASVAQPADTNQKGMARTAAIEYYNANFRMPEDAGWSCIDASASFASRGPEFQPYAAFPIKRCSYSRSHPASSTLDHPARTLLASVWLLIPKSETLAAWAEQTCNRLSAQNRGQCGRKIAEMVYRQNNGHFAIAGHILETQSEAGCSVMTAGCEKNLLIYLPYRHGVTVRMVDDPTNRRNTSFSSPTDALLAAERTFGPIAAAGTIGRVANVSRPPNLSPDAWVVHNRDAYLSAIAKSDYPDLDRAFRAFCKKRNDCGL